MEKLNSVFSYKPMLIMGYTLPFHPLIEVNLIVGNQLVVKLGVGGPLLIKAPSLEGLLRNAEVFGSF